MEWKDLVYLDEKSKSLVGKYFKNKKGKFMVDNNTLILNIESWGQEKFYLYNQEPVKFYNVEHESIRNIYDIAITVQIGNWETFKKMESYLNNFKNFNVNIYFVMINTVATPDNINYLKKYGDSVILSGENKGMDIGLFFIALHYIRVKKFTHEYLFKIHTKTSDSFRNETLNNMIGSYDKIINNIRLLSTEDVGMIGGNTIFRFHEQKDVFHSNYYYLNTLVQYLFNEKINNNYLEFAAATFFIMKYKIFNVITTDKLEYFYSILNNVDTLDYYWYSVFYNININNKEKIYKDFITNKKKRYPNNLNYQMRTNKAGLRDCMIEHAFERLFGYICKKQNYSII